MCMEYSSWFLILPFFLPLSYHCLLWSFSMLSLCYGRSFSFLICCACFMWYINIWRRLTAVGAVPVWWKRVIWCGRTQVQRTGASKPVFAGITALLIEISTALRGSTSVLSLSKWEHSRAGGSWESPLYSALWGCALNPVFSFGPCTVSREGQWSWSSPGAPA